MQTQVKARVQMLQIINGYELLGHNNPSLENDSAYAESDGKLYNYKALK